MHSSFRILSVCTGNICRSPLAAQLLSLQLHDVSRTSISPVGIRPLIGHPMPDPAQDHARLLGVESPELHWARSVTEELNESSDLVLAMSREHRRWVAEVSPRTLHRVFTLREFSRLAAITSESDVASEIGMSAVTVEERLRTAVKATTYARSSLQPLDDPDGDDVIDPYQQGPEIYAVSTQQLVQSVEATVLLFRRVLAGVYS